MKKWFSVCLIFLFIVSSFVGINISSAVDYQTHTDFIATADKAAWKSSYGDQPFPGKAGSRVGGAYWVKNVTMENGQVYPLILQTTPDVKSSGYIMGTYPEITIPEKARLNAEFGFPKNADKTTGVTFYVSFNVAGVKGATSALVSKFKAYTQNTEKVIVSMANYAGKKGNFVVMVIGGKAPTLADVASWSKLLLEVEQPPKVYPDLIIKDIQVAERKVSYTIQNIGTGATPMLRKGATYNTRLTVDGREVAIDKLNSVLDPKESMVRTFPDYVFPASKNNQTLLVCADYNTIIEESNERNNCLQKVVPAEIVEEYPDLVITNISIDNNRVSYTLKNNGPGATSNMRKGKVFQTSLSLNGEIVALDTIVKSLNPQDELTRTFFNFLLPSSKEEQTIIICADADDAFQETNERNNCLRKVVPPVPLEEYPDLVITKIEVEKGKVSYTIKNIGKGSTLTLFKGEVIQNNLTLNGTQVAVDSMAQGLLPSQEITRTFPNYLLPISKEGQLLFVCADYQDDIQETNERNNCFEKDIPPEPVEEEPLRFTKLPEVTSITSKSVKITWETNHESSSWVFYDLRFNLFVQSESSETLTKIHEIILSGLNPDTMYHFFVRSVDQKGEGINSSNGFFKTLPERLNIKPTLRFSLAEKLTGKIKIIPVLSNANHFRRLRLFLDGKLIIVNYTKPFELDLDTIKFRNGSHEIKLEGVDINGNKIAEVQEGVFFNPELTVNTGPVIDIVSPAHLHEFPNNTLSIPVKASIDHRSGLDIKTVYVYVDGHMVYSSTYAKRKRNKIWASARELPKELSLDLSIEKFGEGGTHEIEVKAIDITEKATTESISVITHTPYWKRPSISCYYGTSIKAWTGNHFTIDFYIANNGTATAKDVDIHIYQDFLPGFIITNVSPSKLTSFDWEKNQQVIRIYLSELGFETGNKVYHLTFDLAPVLTPYCDWDDFVIINEVELCYDWDENPDPPQTYILDISQDAGTETEWMAGNCDYLIASNLGSLYDITTPLTRNSLQLLLKKMSELAIKRQGIVGLIKTPSPGPYTARIMLRNMGSMLNSSWDDSGYLLLVGETEVIPTFSKIVGTYEFDSDAPFANTSGNENYPELTLGRIIGDSVSSMIKPIKASLDVLSGAAQFRRDGDPSSVAYCLSGVGDGESSFWGSAEDVAEILEDEMHTVHKRRGQDIIDDGDSIHETFQSETNGLSVIFYRDHGGTHCWCGGGVRTVSSKSDQAEYAADFSFGNYRPFLFACCCQSGNFSGIYGIADLFMEKVGAYIGATEDSSRSANNSYSQYFFNQWVNHPSKSLGTAFKETRIESRDNTRWNLEYHYFGDVKFGIKNP